MSLTERTLQLLGDMSVNRNPNPSDSRHLIGSWAARSVLQYFAVEYLVHLTWTHYDYLNNFISDLGARNCVDSGCGSSFVVADLSFMALGVGALVAASLITSTVLRVAGSYPKFQSEAALSRQAHPEVVSRRTQIFQHIGGEHFGRKLSRRHHLTTALRISMGLTGAALIGVGAMPEDYMRTGHLWSTGVVVVGSVATLTMLGVLWLPERPKTAAFLLILAAISVVGAIVLGATVMVSGLGESTSWVPLGLFERFVVYGFILGMATMGLALTNGAHKPLLPASRPGVQPDTQRPGRQPDNTSN